MKGSKAIKRLCNPFICLFKITINNDWIDDVILISTYK